MKTRSETFQIAKQMPWENPGPGITRQIMGYDGQLMIVKVKFEKGAVGTLHEHYHSQATYVASGKFELTIGDKKQILEAGDGYYVAPDELHGCVCLEEGILIDTFSPVRADFLGI
jgi:quercetin dioxygenase-like cupin family protein